MTAQSQDQSERLPGTVFTPRQVRMLKIAVVVMSIALVGGFALLIIGMVHQAGQIGKEPGSAAAPPAASAPSVAADGFELRLKPGEAISHMALGDNRIAVHVAGPEGEEIRIIDLGTGSVVTRMPVTRE